MDGKAKQEAVAKLIYNHPGYMPWTEFRLSPWPVLRGVHAAITVRCSHVSGELVRVTASPFLSACEHEFYLSQTFAWNAGEPLPALVIAALEHVRQVEQAARGGDSSGDGKSTYAMSLDVARRIITAFSHGGKVDWIEPFQSNAIENAEHYAHPDSGGSAAAMKLVRAAKQVILGQGNV